MTDCQLPFLLGIVCGVGLGVAGSIGINLFFHWTKDRNELAAQIEYGRNCPGCGGLVSWDAMGTTGKCRSAKCGRQLWKQ